MSPDPFLAAVAMARATYDAMGFASDEETEAAADVSIAAEETMLATLPTTTAGVLALVEEAVYRQARNDMIAAEYLPAILAACRAVLTDREGA